MEVQKRRKQGFGLWAVLLLLVAVARLVQPLIHHHEESFFEDKNSHCVLCTIMRAEALPVETPHIEPEEHLRAEILPEPCRSLCPAPVYTYKQPRAPTQFFCLI